MPPIFLPTSIEEILEIDKEGERARGVIRYMLDKDKTLSTEVKFDVYWGFFSKSVDALTYKQVKIVDRLLRLSQKNLEERPHSTDLLYNWNTITTIGNVLRIAKSIFNQPKDIYLDCWLSDFTLNSSDYPALSVRQMEFSAGCFISQTEFSAGRFRPIRNTNLYPKVFKVVSTLCHPDLLLDFQRRDCNIQGAHLCKNTPQRCVNPSHIDFFNDADNKSQNGCRFGAAFLCPHRPQRCIFTDGDGHWLPCRNAESLVLCTHRPSCFDGIPGYNRPEEQTRRIRKRKSQTS